MVDRDLALGHLQQVVLDASKVGAETVQWLLMRWERVPTVLS